jgi:transposase
MMDLSIKRFKIHAIVNEDSMPLSITLEPGNEHDSKI